MTLNNGSIFTNFTSRLPLLAQSPMFTWAKAVLSRTSAPQEFSPATWYQMLEAYYLSNGLYDGLQVYAFENNFWIPAMKPLRNPAYRVVELYVSKLWPGSLPEGIQIKAKNEAIVDPIHQIWSWSNWAAEKQVFARWFSLFGDGFLKVSSNALGDRVLLQNIKPQYVTDLEEDEEGGVSYIRIDIPKQRRTALGELENYYYTEEWATNTLTFRKWETKQGPAVRIEQLGAPLGQNSFEDFGILYIPIVHGKFRDIGEDRGLGVFVPALDKIDEANRMATRLNQLLFRYNKPTIVVSSRDRDSSGRPLPAPKLDGQSQSEEADMKDDEIFYMPGMSQMEHLVPKLDYDAVLKVLKDHMDEIEHDLPELAYYRIRELGRDLSGRAVRLLLADAFDKITEARATAEATLVTAHKMALDIGITMGIFPSLSGTFYDGGFDHQLGFRDVVSVSELEKAETMRTGKQGGVPVATMARRVGWTEDEIEQMFIDREYELELEVQEAEDMTKAEDNTGG